MQYESIPLSPPRAKPFVYGSVCSGIEAATVAWHPLGWQPAFFSEIDNFPRAVLSHRYPHIPLHGDFTTIKENDYAAIDLLVGGTPCQAFSVAGLRKGFADERGNLTLEFVRLAQRLRPQWLVWENVPGVLSIDGGRAFGSFLGGLAECGYGFAYRVLDAQHFGVPQRRRRVFVIGYLGDWRPPAAVLLERESLLGDTTPSREKGEGVAHDVAPSLTGSDRGVERTGESRGQDPVVAVRNGCWWDGGQLSQTLDAVLSKGQTMPEKNRFPAVLQPVTHALRGEGFDASEDGTGRGTPLVSVQPYTLAIRGREGESRFEYRSDGLANAILTPSGGRAGMGVGAVAIPILEAGARTGVSTSDPRAGIGIGESGDPMFTLQTGKQHAIGFSCKDHGGDAGDTSPTLRAMGHGASHANAGGQVAVAFAENQRAEVLEKQVIDGLKVSGGKPGQGYPAIRQAMQVRRLTPRECERLQGFPDDYSLIPYRGKPAADGPRYKALGNSMAVPCMRWIGERIQLVEELNRRLSEAA